jgi:hypothetical protein
LKNPYGVVAESSGYVIAGRGIPQPDDKTELWPIVTTTTSSTNPTVLDYWPYVFIALVIATVLGSVL